MGYCSCGNWVDEGGICSHCGSPLTYDEPDEDEDNYTTLAGFILSLSGTIPDEEDKYECGRFIFEIIDIDGHQIDKVLVTDLGPEEPMAKEE